MDWPILPMKGTEAEKIMTDSVFANCGTPSAYMLDGEGKVEHRLVVGSDAIVDMVRSVIKKASLTKSRIEREGLKVGTPAPVFRLQDIHDPARPSRWISSAAARFFWFSQTPIVAPAMNWLRTSSSCTASTATTAWPW